MVRIRSRLAPRLTMKNSMIRLIPMKHHSEEGRTGAVLAERDTSCSTIEMGGYWGFYRTAMRTSNWFSQQAYWQKWLRGVELAVGGVLGRTIGKRHVSCSWRWPTEAKSHQEENYVSEVLHVTTICAAKVVYFSELCKFIFAFFCQRVKMPPKICVYRRKEHKHVPTISG